MELSLTTNSHMNCRTQTLFNYFLKILLALTIYLLFNPNYAASAVIQERTNRNSKYLNLESVSIEESVESEEWTKKGSRFIESIKLREPSWNVAIYKNVSVLYEYLCSGVLIHSRLVLTSAHCLQTTNYTQMRVRDGNHVFHKIETCTFPRGDFQNGFWLNDIALLRLEKPSEVQRTLDIVSKDKEEHFLHKAEKGGNLWVTDFSFRQQFQGVIDEEDYEDAQIVVEWQPPLMFHTISKSKYNMDVEPMMKEVAFVPRKECKKFYEDYIKWFATLEQRIPDEIRPTIICIAHNGSICERCRGRQLLISSLAPLKHPGAIVNFSLLGNRLQTKNYASSGDRGNRIELYTSIYDYHEWISCTLNNIDNFQVCSRLPSSKSIVWKQSIVPKKIRGGKTL